MPKIFENSIPYLTGKSYVVWSFKQYYDKVIIEGLENIPKDEPVIFAPNHLNALMDALAILSLPPFKKVKVYLSRADLFYLPKPIVLFLRFAKLMPAYRIRDGYENLTKNKVSFEEADEVLLHNAALCIMPEGDQGTERKIRPLVKGIFRIAFSAQQKMPKGTSVNIIPVGFDYGDLIKPNKHLIINIGKPIRIADYFENYQKNPAIVTNAIKQKLQSDLENLVLHLGTEKYYHCFETAIEAANSAMMNDLECGNNPINQFQARQKLGKVLMRLAVEEPEVLEQLDITCRKYKSGMQKIKIDSKSLDLGNPSLFGFLFNYIDIIISVLLALPGLLLNIIPFMLTSQIPRIIKIEYTGFFSSVYYSAGIILFPVFYVLQSILLIDLFSLPLWSIILLIPLHFLEGKFTFRLSKNIRLALISIRLFIASKKHPETLKMLRKMKQQITETLINRAF